MKAVNGHNQAVIKTLPKLAFDISALFVAVQVGLAALKVTGHFIATHFKH